MENRDSRIQLVRIQRVRTQLVRKRWLEDTGFAIEQCRGCRTQMRTVAMRYRAIYRDARASGYRGNKIHLTT